MSPNQTLLCDMKTGIWTELNSISNSWKQYNQHDVLFCVKVNSRNIGVHANIVTNGFECNFMNTIQ